MKSASAATASARIRFEDAPDRAWRERSGRLFAEFERPARAMVRRAFRGAFSSEEVDDVYAAAWLGTLRALASRHEQLSDDEIRSYVLTAVAHQAGKELRRRRRKPTAPLELVGGVPDAADGPDERASSAEESRVTKDLLASMPPRRRAVMLLRYGWGLEPQHVCRLLTGLSPRAYRKEITRGIDELTEKMRTFERGEWCADREQVLKAFAAGLADADERRQAKAHLSHCRECSAFVARISSHLHDLGSAAAVPVAIHGLGADRALGDLLAELGGRARELAHDAFARSAVDEASGRAAVSGARGAGAAGVGAFAKLAGVGVAGKLAIACVGGGVLATACVAAGINPFGESPASHPPAHARQAGGSAEPADGVVATPVPNVPSAPSDAEAESSSGDATSAPEPRDDARPAEPGADSTGPVAPETPPAEQEFGVEAAAVAAPASGSAPSQQSSSGGGGSAAAVRQEFGP
jgi:RNA polymerase sigma factor (sigma-70 family)